MSYRGMLAALSLLGLAAPVSSFAASERAAAHAAEANRLYAAGRLRETVAAMAAAASAEPGDPQLHFMYATALFRVHDYVKARRAYERAAELRWEHPDTHLNLGFACFHSGDGAAARVAWREAVRQSPADPMARLAHALGEWTCENREAALLEMDLAMALGDPVSLLDERTEVRWGLRGVKEVRRLLEVWRQTPVSSLPPEVAR